MSATGGRRRGGAASGAMSAGGRSAEPPRHRPRSPRRSASLEELDGFHTHRMYCATLFAGVRKVVVAALSDPASALDLSPNGGRCSSQEPARRLGKPARRLGRSSRSLTYEDLEDLQPHLM
mmetsp:Transcript_6481/g.18559  ORF Transcript_6481/g.18559 Transcript_6481/m.18559 type:complete len:121 (+) Transcript_6481:93-455(+)